MKKTLLISLTLIAISSLAQNWNLINPNYTYNYAVDTVYDISIHTDSIKVIGNDSIFYLNRIVSNCDTCSAQNYDWNPVLLRNQPTFLQRQVLKTANKYVFSDTLSFAILPHAELNETWIFDTIKGINAEVVGESLELVLGVSDSLKYILLSTNDSIIISKNLGIIRFDVSDTSHYHLMGVERPSVGLGFVVPKFADFFNFNVGDVFQYNGRSCGSIYSTGNGYEIKKTILSKEDNGDTITYYLDKIVASHGLVGCSMIMDTFLYQTIDTLVFIDSAQHMANSYNRELYFERFPEEIFSSNDSVYYGIMHVEFENNTPIKHSAAFPFFHESPSNQNLLISGMEGTYSIEYKFGLGITYEHFGFFETGSHTELIGYIKNGDTTGIVYGDELYLKVENKTSEKQNFSIFPNPTKDKITIQLENQIEEVNIELFDIYGKLILQKTSKSQTEIELNLEHLDPGLFILNVNGFIKKIIKE